MDFNPIRFLEVSKNNPEATQKYFLPFGGGNRVCVGEQLSRMEQRIFLARILQKYKVEVKDAKPAQFPVLSFQSKFRLVPFNS